MDIIPREKYFKQIEPFIKKNIIKVLVGQRRVGKSCLLKYLANIFLKEDPTANIIFIDKELYDFEFISNDKILFEYITSKLKRKNYNYLLIDEVQEIPNFEKVLRDLLKRKNLDIYVTGSNAYMFSSELATLLSGRYIEVKVNPLSFVEFVKFHNTEVSESSLSDYLRFGGMPFLRNLPLENETVFSYLKNVYDTILLKDVVSRNRIRNVDFLIRLTEYLSENTGNLISANKIAKYLKKENLKIPVNTIINYLKMLENSFLIEKVKRAEIKGKKIFDTNEKYYFEDLGIRNALIGFRSQDIGRIIENAVFLHLQNIADDIKIGAFGEKEIDFVVKRRNTKLYVQVAYLLQDEKTVKREFENLLSIKDNYRKIVVSYDKFHFDDYEGIQHFTLIDFLHKFDF